MKNFCIYVVVFGGTHVDTQTEKTSSPKNPTELSDNMPRFSF